MIIIFIKKYWQLIIIGILLTVIFSMNKCSNNIPSTKKQKVIVPEAIDSIKKPTVIYNYPSKKDSIVYKKGKTIYTENPIDKKMAEELIQAIKDQDSLKVLRLYLSSIGEREQTRIFNDKNTTIEVYTKVQGQVLDQRISKYIYKEKEVVADVEIKESKFAIYGGSNLQYTSEMKIVPSVQLGVQIGKRLIITGGYGLDQSYQAGFLYKIKL
jgi:hypothetical protein